MYQNNLEFSFLKDSLCQVWPNTTVGRRFIKFLKVFSLFTYNLSIETDLFFIWTNFNSLHLGLLSYRFSWKWSITGSTWGDFSVPPICFPILLLSHSENVWEFILTNLNPYHPWMILQTFIEIGPVVMEK